jgi:hypothetical protein
MTAVGQTIDHDWPNDGDHDDDDQESAACGFAGPVP